MKRTNLVLGVAAFVLMTVTSGWALMDKGTSLEGTITSISSNMLIISSQSTDGKAAQVTNLAINNETKLNNVGSLSELKPGDKVKVDFKDEGTQKIALTVDKQAATDQSKTSSM